MGLGFCFGCTSFVTRLATTLIPTVGKTIVFKAVGASMPKAYIAPTVSVAAYAPMGKIIISIIWPVEGVNPGGLGPVVAIGPSNKKKKYGGGYELSTHTPPMQWGL